MKNLSNFGQKFTQQTGISRLMEDMSAGLSDANTVMLGGGNPAKIPEMDAYFTDLFESMAKQGVLSEALCNYDGPSGNRKLLKSLAKMLNDTQGWQISEKNIALTNGSQSAFFYLFNLFAGKQPGGSQKKVLFPLTPEYLGYSDAGLEEQHFIATKPTISYLEQGQFKYHLDLDNLPLNEDIGLICVSRPTNPTGNVITDEELQKLDQLAQQHQIPLLIDNAYGLPFPGIIFEPVTTFWNENTILCMSLSKLGLPGARCGIVIANEKVIHALSQLNGIISLAPGSIGPAIAQQMVENHDLLRCSSEIIKPYYQQKAQQTIQLIRKYLSEERCLIHKPEGAIFLWLWFPELPITTEELYQRLKVRGVLIVPGHLFFPGLQQDWPHTTQCIRMNYTPELASIEQAIKIIAEEIELAWQNN